MLHIKYLTLIFGMVLLIGIVSSATYYVTDPDNCPSSDGTNFPGQNCAPQDICGDSSGIAQCYDTSTMNPPAGSSTTTGSGGTNYICSDATCDGGFITNCYATIDTAAPYCDNNGAYLVDRNSTCYNKHVQTTATGGAFASSTCSATCTTNYFQCDGSTTDDDGCEILAGSSCGSGTGTVVYNQCYSSTAGNCTSSTRLDCDNSDSDGNPATCNVGNGCEILIGGACTVGSLSGTYGSTCTGSSGTCIVSKSYFQTGTLTEYQTNASQSFLWGTDYNLGTLLNLSWSVGGGFMVNASGAYFNGTLLGSGTETDPLWTADKPNYYNKTDILGFSYYNLTNFDINNYYLKSNPFGFYNITNFDINNYYLKSNPFGFYNITNFDINNYYLKSNPFGFFNTSNTYNCSNGQYVQNLTLNSSGVFGKCSAPTLSESDPLWTGNQSNYYNQTQSNATYFRLNYTNVGYLNLTSWINTSGNVTASWFLGYLNWSNIQNPKTALSQFTNDLNFINSTYGNATYLKLSGGNLTGNLNISASNLTLSQGNFICLNQLCTQWIKPNVTGVFIQG